VCECVCAPERMKSLFGERITLSSKLNKPEKAKKMHATTTTTAIAPSHSPLILVAS